MHLDRRCVVQVPCGAAPASFAPQQRAIPGPSITLGDASMQRSACVNMMNRLPIGLHKGDSEALIGDRW